MDAALCRHRSGPWFVLAGALAVVLTAPHLMPDSYWLRIYTMAGLYVMLAMGLNVVAGFAGLLDLAYVAFFGLGGYIFAFLASAHFGVHLPFLLVLPLAALASALVGLVLGSTSVRLKGDYLAIVTLAFAQIFKLLLLNLDQPVNITGGVNGIYGFDTLRILGLTVMTPRDYAYLVWLGAVAVVIGCRRLKRSRYGRGWVAIREDETAAGASGVPTARMKLLAFACGALIAGGTGAIFASFQDSVFPNNFDFPQLVVVYCMVILGGMGSIPGVVAGAVILAILPEFLREYGAYRMMLYGLVLIVLMALRPKGLLGEIGWLTRGRRRPDRDTSGTLRASTELYYHEPRPRTAGAAGRVHAPTDRVLLQLEEVSRDFGGLRAVDRVSLTVHEHEIVSIIGPNGAGKSTLFNMISGIYAPSDGCIRFDGRPIDGLKPHQVVGLGIARTFQNLRLFNQMSVLDHARVGRFCRTRSGPLAILLHLPRFGREERRTTARAAEVLDLFGARLTGYRFDQPATSLSYANRRRLEIARALATEPRLLLLDEPSAGMNPQETTEMTAFIRRLRDELGCTVLVIEHKLDVVRSISDRVVALDFGTRIAEGTYADVACNPRVIEAYLGRKGIRSTA